MQSLRFVTNSRRRNVGHVRYCAMSQEVQHVITLAQRGFDSFQRYWRIQKIDRQIFRSAEGFAERLPLQRLINEQHRVTPSESKARMSRVKSN